MSWKAEVIAVNSGKWVDNHLRFATKGEALSYILTLSMYWTAIRDFRIVECDDPVTEPIAKSEPVS